MSDYKKFNKMIVNLEDYEISSKDKENFKINDIEKKKILNSIKGKKKNIWKKVTTVAIAAVFGLVVFGQTNIGKEVYAKAKLYLENVFIMESEIYSAPKVAKYANKVDDTVEFGIAEVRLIDVLLYDKKISLNTLIQLPEGYNEKEDEIPAFKDIKLKINGKKFDYIENFSTVSQTNNKMENYYVVYYEIELEKKLPKGKIDLEIEYIGLDGLVKDNIESSIDETVKFNTVVDTNKLYSKQKEYKVNESLETDEFIFKVKNIIVNPININISGKLKYKNKEDKEKYYYSFKLIDDYGVENYAYTAFENGYFRKEYHFTNTETQLKDEDFYKKVDELKLQFYKIDKGEDGKIENIGEPFTIKLK
ncbi:MAG: hypothetical protein WAO56_02810 [Miniphocaeibacter sp.]|uniref:hypothetical protein n=1 Tax=Miniphocaeibacter sp. TaxID=3100973 RepID=UPI0017DE12AA|nr:hypothetical protein [Gallicola sp.]